MTSTVPAPVARTADGHALQAVLLDMDGTLVDTEGFWWEIEADIFRELGHRLDESWRDIVVGGPMSRSAAFLIEATGAAIGLAELSVLLNERFEARIADQVPLMPGAERLLSELARHNVPTALVSASHRRVIDQVLLTLGRDRFTMTVAGDEVARTKPHPDPYLLAASTLGAHPRAAPSSRTPPPASPPPRPPAAGSWPCPPSATSSPPRAAPSCAPWRTWTCRSCAP